MVTVSLAARPASEKVHSVWLMIKERRIRPVCWGSPDDGWVMVPSRVIFPLRTVRISAAPLGGPAAVWCRTFFACSPE